MRTYLQCCSQTQIERVWELMRRAGMSRKPEGARGMLQGLMCKWACSKVRQHGAAACCPSAMLCCARQAAMWRRERLRVWGYKASRAVGIPPCSGSISLQLVRQCGGGLLLPGICASALHLSYCCRCCCICNVAAFPPGSLSSSDNKPQQGRLPQHMLPHHIREHAHGPRAVMWFMATASLACNHLGKACSAHC